MMTEPTKNFETHFKLNPNAQTVFKYIRSAPYKFYNRYMYTEIINPTGRVASMINFIYIFY